MVINKLKNVLKKWNKFNAKVYVKNKKVVAIFVKIQKESAFKIVKKFNVW